MKDRSFYISRNNKIYDEWHNTHISSSELAKKYGLTQSSIFKIIKDYKENEENYEVIKINVKNTGGMRKTKKQLMEDAFFEEIQKSDNYEKAVSECKSSQTMDMTPYYEEIRNI